LDSYGGDPTTFLKTLKSVSHSVTNLGDATIRGTKTTHYRATVDLEKAAKLRGVRPGALDQYKAALGSTILPEDVYLDDQGRTRRVSLTITPKSGSAAAESLKSEAVSVDFYDFGNADTSGITAPPASETVDFSQVPALAGSVGG
jgi:hypothetical protein